MKKKIALFLALAFFIGGTATLRAETQWQKDHPVRTKNHQRVRHQERTARRLYKQGKISKSQERADIKTDRGILHEQRADARSNDNGGHLNKQQAQALNQQLNAQRGQLNAQGAPAH